MFYDLPKLSRRVDPFAEANLPESECSKRSRREPICSPKRSRREPVSWKEAKSKAEMFSDRSDIKDLYVKKIVLV
jgi:hypothetical protein